MRKKIRFAVALFLMIVTVIPWIEGVLFKMHYMHLIELVNNDNRVKIDLIEYRQGWLHSHAKIHLSINKALLDVYQLTNNLNKATMPLEFDIEENIIHGPIIYNPMLGKIEFGFARINSDINFTRTLQTLLLGTATSYGVIKIGMLSEFDGDWSGDVIIPAISVGIQDIGKATWQGLSGNFKIVEGDVFIKMTRFNGKINSILFDGDEQYAEHAKLMVKPVKYQYKMVHNNSGLISGNSLMWSSGANIMRSGKPDFTLTKVALRTALSMDQNTIYNTNLTLNINHLTLPSEVITDVSQLHVMLTASNFNSQGLVDFLKNFQSYAPAASNIVDLQALESLLIHTITPTSIVRGDLSLNSSLGAFTCHMKSSWQQDLPAPNKFTDIIASADTRVQFIVSAGVAAKFAELYNGIISVPHSSNGRVLVVHLQSKTYSSADVTPAEQNVVNQPQQTTSSQQLLDDLVIGGFLDKDKNNNYMTNLTIQSGIWKLNGRPVN